MLSNDGSGGALPASLGVLAEGDRRAVPSNGGNLNLHGVVRHHDVGVHPLHFCCPCERLFLGGDGQVSEILRGRAENAILKIKT